MGQGEVVTLPGVKRHGLCLGSIPTSSALVGGIAGNLLGGGLVVAVMVQVHPQYLVVVAAYVERVNPGLGSIERAPPHLGVGVRHIASLPDLACPDRFALDRRRPERIGGGRQAEQARVQTVGHSVVYRQERRGVGIIIVSVVQLVGERDALTGNQHLTARYVQLRRVDHRTDVAMRHQRRGAV